MRVLFVSSTTVGGSGRSQRELAARLTANGHVVLIVADDERRARWRRLVDEQLSDLAARVAHRRGARFVQRLASLPGRRVTTSSVNGVEHWISPVPENAARRAFDRFRPDVVVGNSLVRIAWRKVRLLADLRHVPTVLYIREEEALNHFREGMPADLVLANARSLKTAIEGLGHPCEFVPSVIETGVTRTPTTRRTALVINPIESRGVSFVWRLAEVLPEVPFVLQESWPLTEAQRQSVTDGLGRLPNVEFRSIEPPGPRLFRDARVLLVPYRVDNRPRVIAEAQANGIPVLAADVPALAEAIGAGGTCLPVDDVEQWAEVIRAVWADLRRYERWSEAALLHSQRPDIEPGAVAAEFQRLVTDLVQRPR